MVVICDWPNDIIADLEIDSDASIESEVARPFVSLIDELCTVLVDVSSMEVDACAIDGEKLLSLTEDKIHFSKKTLPNHTQHNKL